ncbi:MAG: homocysteine S-methyltransferase family protein [Oscillospiraceae bacterium]|nr:homocysteine S-methyltransferase family protein [Oscillospiraceae bacterium]
MKKDIVLLDGAVGTTLWEKTDNKVAVWRYNIEQPDIVRSLHDDFVGAGAEIILANTFGANRISMKNTGYNVPQIVSRAMELAHERIDGHAKIALAVGPLSMLLEPYGDLSCDEAYEIFDEQISAGAAGRPDLVFIQTFMDIEMVKLAVKAANRHDLPVFCSMTFDERGRTMMGNSVQDMISGLAGFKNIAAVGLNCSLGPDAAVPVMKKFREYTDLPLLFKPNAGKPTVDEKGGVRMQFDIDTFVDDALPALDCGVKYIGGCCGCNGAYIARLHERLTEKYGYKA